MAFGILFFWRIPGRSPMLTAAIVSSGLAVVAVGMLATHLRAWKRTLRRERDPVELKFAYEQLRRRTKASTLLITLAIAIVAGQFLHSAWWIIGYWSAMLVVVAWVCVLAMQDMSATRRHYGRLRSIQMAEQAKLEASLRAHPTQQEHHPHDDLV